MVGGPHSKAVMRLASPREAVLSLAHAPESAPHPLNNAHHLDSLLADLARVFEQRAEGHDREARFPFDNLADLHEHGLIAAVVPQFAAGGGASLATARRIIASIARAEPSTALILTMTFLVHRSLSRADSRWSERWRDELWRSAVEDGALANALRVEPNLGTPARGGLPATLASRSLDGWTLTGHKLYTTGIPALRWLVVYARTDETEPRVGYFLVARDSPGIRVIESWDHLGLRASGSHEVVFDKVALGHDQAVDIRVPGQWGDGPDADYYAWMITLLGALYDGIARAAREWILQFLVNRVPGNLGAPLSTLPRIQQQVGEMDALLWANSTLLDDLVRRADDDAAPSVAQSGLVKFQVTNNAVRVVDLAMQLAGNHGLSRHNPLERHHRDVLCSRIHTPQDDSILVTAGRAAFERDFPHGPGPIGSG